MAWSSDWAPGGKAGPTRNSSAACNAPEWPQEVDPGSTPSQTSFRGGQWRGGCLAGDPCVPEAFWRWVSFSPFFPVPMLLYLNKYLFVAAWGLATLLSLLHFPLCYMWETAFRYNFLISKHQAIEFFFFVDLLSWSLKNGIGCLWRCCVAW